MIFGAKGDRFDLILNSLFFRGSSTNKISIRDYQLLSKENRGLAIPLNLGFSAKGYPLVGTTPEYFESRNITLASGTLPLRNGEVTLGNSCAKKLGLNTGGFILTDQVNLYDLSASYPIRLKVSGVLEKSNTADDEALFVNLQSSWIIEGIGHGHIKLDENTSKENVLSESKSSITANSSLENYIEITDLNIDQFHFHQEKQNLPISSVLIFPSNFKDRTILKGKYNQHLSLQPLIPSETANEILNVIFKIENLLNASFILSGLAATLFLITLILLSLQLRKNEFKTLHLIGCDRLTVIFLYIGELMILITMSLILAFVSAVTLKNVLVSLII